MAADQESFNKQLYELLRARGYHPIPKNIKNQNVDASQDADVFEFVFKKAGQEYGKAWATIDNSQQVTVYYDSAQTESPEGKTPGIGYDDSWYGFLKHLKTWAQRRQLSFELANRDRLSDDMKQREYWKMKQRMDEGYYPMGKQASYNDAIPTVKIIIQHTRQVQEGEQRFRNVDKIFLENQTGEKFLAPTNRPGIAQVYARHIAEGGVPNDERWNHIKTICEEYNKMAGFVRATKRGEFNESVQTLINEGVAHYQSLRETLGKMRTSRGYNTYFESWTPALMEEESDESIIGMFIEDSIDPRIESAMPILSKLSKRITEMSEVRMLEEWADAIVEGQDLGQHILDKLAQIVDNKQAMPVSFVDGKTTVDLFTASAVLQVYNALSAENKEKVSKMISSKNGFMKFADFAFKQAAGKTEYVKVGEEKTRLDKSCWDGYKIGNPKTKTIKRDGKTIRVNNCVKEETTMFESRGSQQYELYHDTYTSAINTALEHHASKGLEVSEDDRWQHIAVNSKKPASGKTTRVQVPATDNKGRNYLIHIQVYHRDDAARTPYELNTYASVYGGSKSKDIHEDTDADESFESIKHAVANRIAAVHLDLLRQHGPDKVLSAIEDVADSVGVVSEIGTSDVSSWVNQVKQILEQNKADDLEEDLGPEQKRAGQLGPNEKVGPNGAVGKLVGESTDELTAITRLIR